MPVVPTSQVRVVPQAPRVDINAFIPRVDPSAGMDVFTKAAQLPLFFEQLGIEKERNKLERNKLKLAEMEANYMANNFDRIRQAQLDTATTDAALKTQQVERERLENEKRKLELAQLGPASEQEIADVLASSETPVPTGQPTDTGAGVSGQTEADRNVEAQPPLANVSVSTAAATPQSQQPPLFNVSTIGPEAAKPAPVEEAEDPRYIPDFSNFPALPDIKMGEDGRPDYSPVVKEELRKIQLAFIGDAPTQATVNQAKKKRVEWLQGLEPKPGELKTIDSRNIPIVVPVVKVGNRVVDTYPENARIDRDTLHQNKAIETADTKFFSRFAETDEAQRANARMNIERLVNAAEYLAKAEQNDKEALIPDQLLFLMDSDKLTALLGGDRAKALNEIRTVIQQSLRETLGAQFARVEGEQMMNRGFNPLFESKANFQLISNALRVAQTAIREKERAYAYYQANGTIFGFKPNSQIISKDGSPELMAIERLSQQAQKPAAAPAKSTGAKPAEVTPEQRQTTLNILLGSPGPN
jgi:hypothetical protein